MKNYRLYACSSYLEVYCIGPLCARTLFIALVEEWRKLVINDVGGVLFLKDLRLDAIGRRKGKLVLIVALSQVSLDFDYVASFIRISMSL